MAASLTTSPSLHRYSPSSIPPIPHHRSTICIRVGVRCRVSGKGQGVAGRGGGKGGESPGPGGGGGGGANGGGVTCEGSKLRIGVGSLGHSPPQARTTTALPPDFQNICKL
jgi:hypothetical protein